MEDIKEKINGLTGHVEDIAETYYRLSVVNIAQRAANITSASITTTILFISGLFVVLLGSIALSWWLGNLIESRAGGFLLGAGFFFLIMIIVLLLRKKIIFPFFRDLIVRKFYD